MILISVVELKKRPLVPHLLLSTILGARARLASPVCRVGMVRRRLGLFLDLPPEAL